MLSDKQVLKNDPRDRIEVVLGDDKQPDFKPQMKFQRWDNEVNFSIRAEEHPQAKKTKYAGITKYKTPDYEVHMYDKPDFGTDGGYEFEWVLKKKPKSNVLKATIQHKNLVFYKQGQPTPEQKAMGMHDAPENVDGSYAVYHKKRPVNYEGGKLYRTGKAFHIYRPEAVDANEKKVWCEIDIDENNGFLTVTIPQDFLDSAKYPVVVDPTFGKETIGALTGSGISAYTIALRAQNPGENGTVTKFTNYCSDPGGNDMECGLYLASSTKVAESTSAVAMPTSAAWTDIAISASVSDQNYDLCIQHEDDGGVYHRDEAGATAGGYKTPTTFSTWPASFSWTDWNQTISVYATYSLPNTAPNTPSITAPTASQTGLSQNPTATSSAFSDPDVGDTHAASQWLVSDDAGFTSTEWDSGEDAVNLTSIDIDSTDGTFGGALSGETELALGTSYWIKVRHKDSAGDWSSYSTAVTFKTNDAPDTPSVTAPTNGATGTSYNPSATSSAFSDDDDSASHKASQWLLSDDAGFTSTEWDSGTDTTNKTSITINDTDGTFGGALAGQTQLAVGTQYWLKVRHQDNLDEWSSYSSAISFTANAAPDKPSITSPTTGATGVAVNPTVTSSAFSDSDDGSSHKASQWQVATDAGFSSVVWDTSTDTSNKVSVVVNAANGTFAGALAGETSLANETKYYVRVRHQDNLDEWSSWDDSGVNFTTESSAVTATSTANTIHELEQDVFQQLTGLTSIIKLLELKKAYYNSELSTSYTSYTDAERAWLQSQTGTTTNNLVDLWKEYLVNVKGISKRKLSDMMRELYTSVGI